ncbi:unnamed protein product [Cylindrotheca closterium]|uniref:Calcineurin-like phosphoesterase domain-containing protein n=1 Tax=Cylindrotheca closterium TaxID=2856 RepID=A0AAD2FMY3_9STRA|nr:unnamed protein product [Cylindrotheca closterium]
MIQLYRIIAVTLLLLLTLVGAALNESSSASAALEGLPWGTVNLLVLTDVHSWIAGHERHESNMNVDYGDVLSFVQRLHKFVDSQQEQDMDLYLVMNGDFMDGTGLSTRPPRYLTPLLKQMPFDVINLGNHELYDNATIDFILDEFIPDWNGHYLTSNTLYEPTRQTLGSQYCILRGRASTTLTFGFLFNFQGHSKNTIVENVQDVVRQSWFQHVLVNEEYDTILVMAHMHVTDPLVQIILDAIREHTNCSVAFVTGHTHLRRYEVLDENSVSFEAGRFLDTIGFMSWNPADAAIDSPLSPEEKFPHLFIDTSRDILTEILHATDNSTNNLPTMEGIRLTDKIHTTQGDMGLLKTVGCSPHVYELATPINEKLSLWGLYIHQIIPERLLQTPGKVYVEGTGSLRYDLMNGKILIDDVISVCPFNQTILEVAVDVPATKLLEALGIEVPPHSHGALKPNSILPEGKQLPTWAIATTLNTGILDLDQHYRVLTPLYYADYLKGRIANVTGTPAIDSITVKKADNPKLNESTTDLWKDYIEANWKCKKSESILEIIDPPPPPPIESDEPPPEERPLVVAFFICFIVLGLSAYKKRRMQYFSYQSIPDAKATEALFRKTSQTSAMYQ